MKFHATVTNSKSGKLIKFSGVLDERCQLPEFEGKIKGNLTLDLEGVKLMNSMGCRKWIQWIQSLKVEGDVVLIKCSTAVVKQINILSGFINDDTKIESIYVPYFCEDCSFEEKHLLEIGKLNESFQMGDVVQVYPCPECGKGMELDMVKSQYFTFLTRHNRKLTRG